MNVVRTIHLSILTASMALLATGPARAADLPSDTCTVVVKTRLDPVLTDHSRWMPDTLELVEPSPSRSFRLGGRHFTFGPALPQPDVFGPGSYSALDYREMEEAGQAPHHWGLSLRFSR